MALSKLMTSVEFQNGLRIIVVYIFKCFGKRRFIILDGKLNGERADELSPSNSSVKYVNILR